MCAVLNYCILWTVAHRERTVIGPDVTLFDAGYCHVSPQPEWTAAFPIKSHRERTRRWNFPRAQQRSEGKWRNNEYNGWIFFFFFFQSYVYNYSLCLYIYMTHLASFLRYIRSLLALSCFLSFHFPVGLFGVFVFRAADPSVGEEKIAGPRYFCSLFLFMR